MLLTSGTFLRGTAAGWVGWVRPTRAPHLGSKSVELMPALLMKDHRLRAPSPPVPGGPDPWAHLSPHLSPSPGGHP